MTPTGYSIRRQQTTAALRAEMAGKRNKYGARKTVLDNIKFDSAAEARHYATLKLRQKIGEIERLQCHPVYQLIADGTKIGKFTPDFQYYDIAAKKMRVIDVKSPPTAKKADFRLRKKLFEAIYKMEVEVVFA